MNDSPGEQNVFPYEKQMDLLYGNLISGNVDQRVIN